jgi:hypothetical protein
VRATALRTLFYIFECDEAVRLSPRGLTSTLQQVSSSG